VTTRQCPHAFFPLSWLAFFGWSFLTRSSAVVQVVNPAFVVLRSFSAAAALDKATIEDRILKVLKAYPKVNQSKVCLSGLLRCLIRTVQLTAEAKFVDLDLDSLDAVEVVMGIEEEFGIEIPDADADKILSTADAISYILAQPNAK